MIAGEASGDEHGAHLARQLVRLCPEARISGVGGPACAAAGVELLFRAENLALVGVSEVFGKIGHIWRAMRGLKRHLRQTRPDLVILIDFPDFNLRLAAYAKKLGLKTLYYISPQVWAWREGRAARMAAWVDHLAVVFPFEKEFYAQKAPNLPVTFVGHPLFDEWAEDDASPRPEEQELVGLLPGSRMSEITRHMPLLRETAKLMLAASPNLTFVLPLAPGLDKSSLEVYWRDAPPLTLLPEAARQVIRRARLLLTASGTATLQAAVAGAPMVVFYKTGALNYFLGRKLIKVRHIAMPNLIYGGGLIPEFIQEAATPEALAAEALALLSAPDRLAAMRQGLYEVRQKLGGPGASARVAQLAMDLIKRPSAPRNLPNVRMNNCEF
jgi:lipid-A-disaccharide synthase